MNVSGKKLINPPFALHFAPYFEHKNSEYNYLGYDKYYKDKRSVTLGKIPNYKILCVESKGLKLARFNDKHVSVACTEQIINYISGVCKKSLLQGKNASDTIDIPLISILSEVKKQYGFHLPHLLLKKSKKIKKIKIEKLLDEKNNICDLISVRISDYL